MGKCILFVDDEPMVLKVLESVFRHHGYAPRCSMNGESALEIIERDHIRVCFVDLKMPGMDGLTLCGLIKKFDPTTCVYALSAFVDTFAADQYRRAGFDGVFNKPFTIDILLTAARDAFEKLDKSNATSGVPIFEKNSL